MMKISIHDRSSYFTEISINNQELSTNWACGQRLSDSFRLGSYDHYFWLPKISNYSRILRIDHHNPLSSH
jgi:hypothetical protein